MADVKLRIEQSDGTVRDTLDAIEGEYTRSFEEQARAEVLVYRDDWTNVEDNIDERNDKFFVDIDGTDEFGGRFDDTKTNGGEVSVRLNSPEIDAAEAEPTGNNLTYENIDPETIAKDAINSVDTLTQGTISLTTTAVSYTISHGSQSKVLYDLRELANAEFKYNADFSVDVVDRLGADKNITLGPSNKNIGSKFSKTVDVREEVTHIRGLGGQDGPNQITAEATSSNYSAGERKVWKRYKNKEIIDKSRLQDIIDNLVSEYDGEPRAVEVKCKIFDEDLVLGDRVTIDYTEENINRDLRIVELTNRITTKGRELLATLSNRNLTREDTEQKRNDDLERFNRGYGGFVDRDNDSYGFQPVNSSVNATRGYKYPDDVVREDIAEVQINSIKYRSFVSAAGHSHDVDVTHPSHSHSVSTTSAAIGNFADEQLYTSSGSASVSDLGSVELDRTTIGKLANPYLVHAAIGPTSGSSETITEIQSRLNAPGINEDYSLFPSTGGEMSEVDYISGMAYIPDNLSNEDLVFDIDFINTAGGGDITVQYGWIVTRIPSHSHDVSDTSTAALGTTSTETSTSESGFDPGINEFTETVSNVDLIVNGNTVSTNINSGEFTETVDISGKLTSGNNTIELASDSLGMVNLTVRTELFRRGQTS